MSDQEIRQTVRKLWEEASEVGWLTPTEFATMFCLELPLDAVIEATYELFRADQLESRLKAHWTKDDHLYEYRYIKIKEVTPVNE